jgi:O-Antigen ligase
MWRHIALVLVVGYACIGRSFAYLGLAPAKIFIGEISLIAFAFTQPNSAFGRWTASLISCDGLSNLGWAYLIFLQYGILELLRGLSFGYDRVQCIQNLVFNVYPLFLFLGIHVGLADPGFLRSLVRAQAWVCGVYGTAYLLFLHRFDTVLVPGTRVTAFGQPGGASMVLVGLLYFERDLKKFIVPVLLNAFVMLGIQVRADWLLLLTCLIPMAILHYRAQRILAVLSVIALLLAIGYLVNFDIPAPKTRGGRVSSREIVGRAVSSIDPEVAAKYAENAKAYAGTITWRTHWWREIWHSVHVDLATTALGHGYGFPLSSLVAYVGDETLRSPHNVFMYALGYTGWIGVVVFYLFVGTLFHSLWRVYRLNGQSFGLIILTGCMIGSHFGQLYETPFGAIPLFIITGAALAPLAPHRQCVMSRLPVQPLTRA